MSQDLAVKCQYCHALAIGINYRPRPEIDNAPACEEHKTSLFVPYASTASTSKGPFASISADMNSRQAKNEEFFEDLMNMIVGEYNLLKSEVKFCEDKLKKLDKNETYGFELPCKVTNPYMLLREDKDMMLNGFLTRIKQKYQAKKRSQTEWSSMKNSRCETRNSLSQGVSPFMKNSAMTVVSSNNKSEYASPKNNPGEVGFFKKLDDVKL